MLKINEITRLYLGIQGENKARTLTIDVSAWIALYPNGSVTIWHKRNGESEPTATGAEYDSETQTVTWQPTSTDTYYDGEGEAEFRLTESEVIKKSKNVITGVSPAVTLAGTTLGSDWQSYINAVDSLRADAVTAKEAAEDAQEAAEDAQEAAEDAQEAAEAAQEAAENAQEAAEDAAERAEAASQVMVPPGGTAGQVLTKESAADFDMKWKDPEGGDPTEIIDDTAGEGDTDKTWSADKLTSDVLSAIDECSNAIYEDVTVNVPLTVSEGEYYKLTGKHSTYNQAKCSQAIPVTAGSKVYVTAKSQNTVAGIVFYNSDTLGENTFVSYGCYTGETVTFTNEEVTVPAGATYAVVQGNINSALALKKKETVNKIEKNASDIAGLQLDSEKVDETYNAVFEEEHTPVALTLTEGKYYKLTGKYGTYDQAKCSQVFEVTAGEKVYVTAKSQASVAGIVFYNSGSASDSTFVSYDCYTGETITFTNEEVTVPVGANHAIVQGNINSTVSIERIGMGSRVQKNTQNITALGNDNEYMASVLRQRFMAIAKDFSWGSYPNMIVSLRVDDLRADIDLFAKIITGEYGFPLDVAACVKNIDKTATGIVDPAERIGDTRLDVCKWVQEHGGEVLVHPDTTFADADDIQELFIDSKRTFENNGIHIRGTAVANSVPGASLKEKLDPYLYLYYDFSDGYGTNPPYNGMTFTMMNNFSNDISDFTSWLNTRIAYQTPVWVTLVMHEIGVDVTENFLRDVLDLLQTNVTQGNISVKLWSEVYDTYGTF